MYYKADFILRAGVMFLAALLATACRPATSPSDSQGDVADSVGAGYVQIVEAKGYVLKGRMAEDWAPYERIRFDSAGREVELISTGMTGEPRLTTDYDALGRKVKALRRAQDRIGNVDYTTSWSEDGLVSTEEEYSHMEKKLVLRTIVRKDSAGHILERTQLNLQFMEYGVDTQRIVYLYDKQGRLALEEEYFKGKKIPGVRYTYDAQGHLVQVERFDADGQLSRTESLEVDAQGRKIALRSFESGNTALRLEQRFAWTKEGWLAEEVRYGGDCSALGEQTGKCIINEKTRYAYDAQGRPLRKEVFRDGQAEPVEQLRYRYEPFKR